MSDWLCPRDLPVRRRPCQYGASPGSGATAVLQCWRWPARPPHVPASLCSEELCVYQPPCGRADKDRQGTGRPNSSAHRHPAAQAVRPGRYCDWARPRRCPPGRYDQQRETSLDKRRGHRARLAAPGTGRRPVLTLADRLLATILHQRPALPQVAIASLFSVRAETINRRIREVRQLLDQAGHPIQPGPHRLASLEDLLSLATAEGIITPSEIKTAC